MYRYIKRTEKIPTYKIGIRFSCLKSTKNQSVHQMVVATAAYGSILNMANTLPPIGI